MAKTTYQTNPSCEACELHKGCSSVCLAGKNSDGRRKLMVFTDYPDFVSDRGRKPYFTDTGKMLDWLFARMSVDPKDVAYEYTLRCYAQETLPTKKPERAVCITECNQYRFASIAKVKPKAIVGLGGTTLEAFTGKSKIGEHEGTRVPAWEGIVRDFVSHIWIGYSLQYILFQGATETVNVFRVLYRAAEEAGLSPELDHTVPPFKWSTVM